MIDDEPRKLPPFPTDDFTLRQLEHALSTCMSVGEDGEYTPVRSKSGGPDAGEFTLSMLLHFMSGYDPERQTLIGYTAGIFGDGDPAGAIPIYEAWDRTYSEHDVIRALIARIRELEGRHE